MRSPLMAQCRPRGSSLDVGCRTHRATVGRRPAELGAAPGTRVRTVKLGDMRGDAEDIDRVTLLVGAGISVPSGAPSFWDLRNAFLRPLVGEDEAEAVGTELLSPELLFDALDDDRCETRRMIRAAMWQACERTRPGPNHTAVARLAAAGARVWTTNFDTLVERAAARADVALRVVAPPDDPSSVPAKPDGPPVLLKVHGTFPYTGDPPREPVHHDYDLLFRSSDVWVEPGRRWIERLRGDVTDRDVHVFGYRGADLDVVPVLLRLLPAARSVHWWELADKVEDLARLRRRFGALGEHVEVHAGDPSAALQELAVALTGDFDRTPVDRPDTPPITAPVPETWTAKAALHGQFRGAATARRDYAQAVLRDPLPLKGPAALRLLRSTGFDRERPGRLMLWTLAHALDHTPATSRSSLWDLYATLADARPVTATTERHVARLLHGPASDRPGTRIRAASMLKRVGDLPRAAELLGRALDTLTEQHGPEQRLEAMAAYNLAWTHRHAWALRDRERVTARYAERLDHLGFNWGAWLGLDDALLALAMGDVDEAGRRLADPFLDYARTRQRHPMYIADEAVVRALHAWHQEGPGAARPWAQEALRVALHAFGRAGTSTTEARLLLADLQRVEGRPEESGRTLDAIDAVAVSPLLKARAAVLRAAVDDDRAALGRLAETERRAGRHLLARSASRCAGNPSRADDPLIHPDLPLPGLV